jgi:hypothetical protein
MLYPRDIDAAIRASRNGRLGRIRSVRRNADGLARVRRRVTRRLALLLYVLLIRAAGENETYGNAQEWRHRSIFIKYFSARLPAAGEKI